MASDSETIELIDIGANLMDDMFKGVYRNKQRHPGDLDAVLERAASSGVRKIIITSTTVEDAKIALDFIEEVGKREAGPNVDLYTTIGIHPTNANCFEESAPSDGSEHPIISALLQLFEEHPQRSRIVAVGEFGLDYERLSFSSKETQLRAFELQFQLAERTRLPLFLHYREASPDFQDVVRRNRSRFEKGVVHSFTGTKDELLSLLELDVYIGVNGCSLRTQENLAVVKEVPIERLLIETDAPWCEIRPSHASYKFVKKHWPQKLPEKYDPTCLVKCRNEPCRILQVFDVIEHLFSHLPRQELAAVIFNNSKKLFFPDAD